MQNTLLSVMFNYQEYLSFKWSWKRVEKVLWGIDKWHWRDDIAVKLMKNKKLKKDTKIEEKPRETPYMEKTHTK